VLLADLGGQRALVGLYEDVASGRPLSDALESRFGLSEAELTRRWQRRLADLAG
jgi:hypothetical protein